MSQKKFQPFLFCQFWDIWGQKSYRQTDRQIFDTVYWWVGVFFSSQNFLPPYSLCSQGDNIFCLMKRFHFWISSPKISFKWAPFPRIILVCSSMATNNNLLLLFHLIMYSFYVQIFGKSNSIHDRNNYVPTGYAASKVVIVAAKWNLNKIVVTCAKTTSGSIPFN